MFHHVLPWQFEEKPRSTKWVLVKCCDLTEDVFSDHELDAFSPHRGFTSLSGTTKIPAPAELSSTILALGYRPSKNGKTPPLREPCSVPTCVTSDVKGFKQLQPCTVACQSNASWLCSRPKTASQAYSSNLEQIMRKKKNCILFQGVLCSLTVFNVTIVFFQNLHFALSPTHRSKFQHKHLQLEKPCFLKIYSSLHLQACHCSKIVKLSTCEIKLWHQLWLISWCGFRIIPLSTHKSG